MTYNETTARRLAAELAEDDERATGDRWGNDGIDVYTLTDSSQSYPLDRYPDSVDVIIGKCERCGSFDVGIQSTNDTFAIARLRNNARAAAEQLAAGVEEIDRLHAKVSDMRSERLRDEIARSRLAAHVDALTLAASVNAQWRADAAKRETDALNESRRLAARCAELEAHVSLVDAREKQATETCTWLTKENQRLRDVAALTKYVDDEIDETLEDSEETDVKNAQLQNRVVALESLAAEACDLAQHYVEHTLPMSRRDANTRITAIRAALAKEGK